MAVKKQCICCIHTHDHWYSEDKIKKNYLKGVEFTVNDLGLWQR